MPVQLDGKWSPSGVKTAIFQLLMACRCASSHIWGKKRGVSCVCKDVVVGRSEIPGLRFSASFIAPTVTVIAVLKVEASWLTESGTYLRLCHQRGVRAGDCPTVLPTSTRASCSLPPITLSLSTQVFLSAICLWVHLLVYEDRCLPLAPHPCNLSMATLILPQRLRLPGPGRYMYSFPR